MFSIQADKFFVIINRRQIELVVQFVSVSLSVIILFQPHLVEAGGICTGIYYKNKLIPWGDGAFPVRVGDILRANLNLTTVN
jgi:hypothetical protein